MTKQKQNSVLNFALEVGPIVVFLLAFKFAPFPDGASNEERQVARVIFSTGVALPAFLIVIAYSWFVEMRLRKSVAVSAALLVLFCGLTILLQDSTLIKNKANVIILAISGIMGFGLLRGKSYASYMQPDGRMGISEEGWLIFTKRATLFLFCYVIVSELLGHYTDVGTWVLAKRVFPFIAFIGFFVAQLGLISEYEIKDEE